MTIETTTKDAADRDSFGFDFSDEVEAGDVITAATWRADPGAPFDTPSYEGTVAKIWIAGGTPGSEYIYRCTATFESGRVLQRAFRLKITDDET